MPDEESKKTQQAAKTQPQPQLEAPTGPAPIDVPPQMKEQAQSFFDRAKQAASSSNRDYAIQMYLEGLQRNPDALEAHQGLLEQALRRQAAGGKKAGLIATLKLKLTGKGAQTSLFARSGSGDVVDELLQAEALWCKDPMNLSLADNVLQKMMSAGCLVSATWLAAWLNEANARSEKPNGQRFAMLADVFAQLNQPDKAVDVCHTATAVLPDDVEMASKLKNMMALQTMRKGRYTDEGFRQSLQDAEGQDQIQEQESLSRRQSLADEQIVRARKELEANPTESSKVMALVEALLLKDDKQTEDEAIQVLQKAHQQLGAYRFKQRAGEIGMRANRRRARSLKAKVEANPDDKQLAKQYQQMLKEHLEIELAHYQDSAKNYPTDMRLRYEIGRRLLQLGRFDEAIPALQDGQRDLKNHLRALSLLGQCFFMKKWYSDAVAVYQRALESPDAAASDIGKELQYYLGRAYQANGQLEEATKAYSTVAQIDFLYKDVRQRLEQLRTKQQNKDDSE